LLDPCSRIKQHTPQPLVGSFEDVVSLFLFHGFGFWFNSYH